jgi:hypothetical protein
VDYTVYLLVPRSHIQPEDGAPFLYAFHIESQQLRRLAFLHALANELGHTLLLFAQFA